MDNKEILLVVDVFSNEKEIDKEIVFHAVEAALEAATVKKHEVHLFAMDEGTRLLEDQDYVSLAGLQDVAMSYCDHSAQELNVNTEGLTPSIERSSQYSNAEMNHYSDKVLVL